MTVFEFQRKLVGALMRAQIPRGARTEQALERRLVTPLAARLAAAQGDVLLFSHPWGNKRHCSPDCATEPPGGAGRVVGCPRCWAASKSWASVEAFGTHHTFDLVAKDRRFHTLAVEIKLVSARGGRMPNGDIQRFLGQVALAATLHDAVIGMCGYRGSLNARWDRDTDNVKKWLKGSVVRLVFRQV